MKLTYKEVKELGFKTNRCGGDNVFKDLYGYDFFIVYLYLRDEEFVFNWDCNTREVTLTKEYENNIIVKLKIKSLEELENFIELLE